MSNESIRVSGVYEYVDSLMAALKELRASGHKDFTIYSPVPHHEFDEFLGEPESKVGYFSMTGGALGWIVGLGLTAGTALLLPLIVGGKPIVSFVPFYVIGFELTILLGGLFTALSFLILGRLSKSIKKEPFNPRFAEDRFGVVVTCSEATRGEIENILRANGAEEVAVA